MCVFVYRFVALPGFVFPCTTQLMLNGWTCRCVWKLRFRLKNEPLRCRSACQLNTIELFSTSTSALSNCTFFFRDFISGVERFDITEAKYNKLCGYQTGRSVKSISLVGAILAGTVTHSHAYTQFCNQSDS